MIDGNRIRLCTTGIVKGYSRAARSAAGLILAVLAVALISAVIVTPLWFVATQYTTLYTVVSICGLTAAVLVPFLIRLVRNAERRGLFIRRLMRLAIFLLLIVSLYFIALLYAAGSYAVAVPLTALFLALTGLILYGKRSV